MNLYDAVEAKARPIRARAAVCFAGRTLRYGGLLDEADRVARGLQEQGLQPGDRVAILSSNRPEHFTLYLAAARGGFTFVPLNPQLAPPELAWIFDHARPRLVFASEAQAAPAQAAIRRSGLPVPVLSFDGVPDGAPCYRELAGCQPLGESRGGGRDRVVICYTSATTGRPKGVAISHTAEIESARATAAIWSMTEADRVLAVLPLSYIYGLTTAGMASLCAGAGILLHEEFDAARVLDGIEGEGITIFMGVPTMYAMLAARLGSGRSADLSGLRLAVCSGAGLPPATAEAFARAAGIPISQQYGLSEIRPVFAHPAGPIEKPGSVGRAVRGVEVRIRGAHGEDLPPGREGDLFVRSPTLMLEYYRDPDLTASVLRDGWLDTGDRAVMDENGHAWIRGRSKEMINRGGEKVSPAEVESALLLHPDVGQAAVVGRSDPVQGQAVAAIVVPRAGRTVSRAALRRHCRAHLADFKVPSVIEIADSLPLGPTGKIDRRRLAEAGGPR